jgi:hypothetical protein
MQMATYGIQTRGVQPQGIVEVLHEQIMSLQTRWQFVRNAICKAKLWWSTCFQGVDFGVFVSRAKQLHYNWF